ncbi:MAG: hypothetical protein ACRDZ6_00400 [Acidimicrobiales bacterium]
MSATGAGVGIGIGLQSSRSPAIATGPSPRGRPGVLLMTVRGLAGTSWVSCDVKRSGRYVAVGNFELYRGSGSWSVRLPTSWAAGEVDGVRLLGPSGDVLAVAHLG